jgi:hypothetical protein
LAERAPAAPRISITLTPRLRKKLRLAAALANMEEPDWARAVIAKMAKATVEKRYPDKV